MEQKLLTPRGDVDAKPVSYKNETKEQTFSFLEMVQMAQAAQEENIERK